METIISVVLGVTFIIIGILNTKGNISMLHSYHRKRVSEADRIPFGRLVGAGSIIIGISAILMGVFTYLATTLKQDTYAIVGTVIFIVGILIGVIINFYAMIKYNKGIF